MNRPERREYSKRVKKAYGHKAEVCPMCGKYSEFVIDGKQNVRCMVSDCLVKAASGHKPMTYVRLEDMR